MTLLTIALAIIMPISVCALNSWLNIKIKFAPDATQAKREVKRVFLRIFNWFSVAFPAGVLVWLFTLPEPMTRLTLVSIIIQCFGLFHSYLIWWINNIQAQIRQANELAANIADALHKQAQFSAATTETSATQQKLISHIIEKLPK